MAALEGLHVVCGYAGGKGYGGVPQAGIHTVQWSETLAGAGSTTLGAVDRDEPKGEPVFLLMASVAGWAAIGSDPDATANPRLYLKAGEPMLVFPNARDKVDWDPVVAGAEALVLLDEAAATGEAVVWPGGAGTVFVQGTWDGATAALEFSHDGTTWWPLGDDYALTDDGFFGFDLPAGSIRAAVSDAGTTDLTAIAKQA